MTILDVSLATEIIAGCSLVVSSYAAWTAHAARRWQRSRDREQRETRLSVRFEHAAERLSPFAGFIDYDEPRPLLIDYALTLIVVNDGETTEWLSGLRVEQPGGDVAHDLGGPRDGDFALKPRGRFTRKFDADLLGWDLTAGFIGVAELASDAEARSTVEHLDPVIAETVREHNRRAA